MKRCATNRLPLPAPALGARTISVPSNIAEGAGRGTDADFRRFLIHSLGSINEVEYDLLLARDLGFLPTSEHGRFPRLIEDVRRMLSGLIATLSA